MEATAEAPAMMLQADKTLLQPIRPHLIAYCPTMDLIAVVTEQESLDVYRLNGQRAFSHKRKNSTSSIDYICWKFNGQSIVVAWGDGLVDIVSAETGKVLQKDIPHPFKSKDMPETYSGKVSCLGWGVNFIDVQAVKSRTGIPNKSANANSNGLDDTAPTTDSWDSFRDDINLDDFLQRQPDLQTLDLRPDLPNQLAILDVESLLPKLPVIPLPPTTPFMRPAQADPGSFTSQALIDTIFHSHHLKDHNAVDVLLRCFEGGTVNPTIYDSLGVVCVRVPDQWGLQFCRPVLHASHPYSCSHGILMEISGKDSDFRPSPRKPVQSSAPKEPVGRNRNIRLALVPLTLRFISSAGIYLHLISSKTTQLQNLLQYVHQCLHQIRAYWTHSQDLPSRFMRNIGETLAEKGEGGLVQSLYHLCVTGNCPPAIKEWLVNELTESGHKRWDHTVTQGYAKVIELTHENLLPALDRCSIVTTTLRGLARYHDSSWIFNVSTQEFTAILDVIRCLRLLGHNILIYAGDERRQFAVFSRWLRHEIDVQATDPTSSSAEEAADRDPGVDYSQLLEYIQGPMSQSDLTPFLQRQADIFTEPIDSRTLSYEDIQRAIELSKQGAPYKQEALCLEYAYTHLQNLCAELFAQITKWQAASTSMDCGLLLEDEDISDARDMRMVFEKTGHPNDITTYVALVPKERKNEIRLHRIIHNDVFDEVPKSIRTSDAVSITVGDGEVVDIKFVDDSSLMALYRTEDASFILSLPYNSAASNSLDNPISYSPRTAENLDAMRLPDGHAGGARTLLDLSQRAKIKPFIKHVFPTSERFVPLKLEVNGRKDRRVACVVGEDLKHYKVFDLDFREREAGKGEIAADEEDDESDIEMTG